ncbi:MAG: glycosyltransferase family 2 protein [bacterium]|nr:glycosyltransferase family 2 protein [bacterium]
MLAKTISIVIPVYNGQASIFRLVSELVAALPSPLEIVLVNDCSPDDSKAECIRTHEAYSNVVTFIDLARNSGEHNAVMAGLHFVSGDFAVIMDDDFQNPPSEVIKMVKMAIHEQLDVVYSYYDKKRHHILRNLGSWFNDKVANVMLKKPSGLYLSSFKVMSRFVVDEIIKYDHPYPYIDGLILRVTSNIGKIRVEHNQRQEGKSNYTLVKLLRLWLNMFTNFSILPLRMAIVLGALTGLFGLGLSGYAIYEKIMNPNLPLGWAALMVVVCLFASVQLISMGLLGEYVGRLFLSMNKSPQFTIRHRYLRQPAAHD